MPQTIETIDEYTATATTEIPLAPGARTYLARDDFSRITGGNQAMMAVLRDLELRFSARCALLRQQLGLSQEQLPPREWLWFCATYDEIEQNCVGVRKRSSLEAVVQKMFPAGRKRKSLVELGYIETRFVAYLTDAADQRLFADLVQRDYDDRAFIVVEDAQGHYRRGEELRSAHLDGCGPTQKQYFIDVNAINAAIAALYGLPWHDKPYLALQEAQRRGETTQETTILPADACPAATPPPAPRLEGVPRSDATGVSTDKRTTLSPYTQEPSFSMVPVEVELSPELACAPLDGETVLRLVAQIRTPVFVVPERHRISAKAWQAEWAQPAEELLRYAMEQVQGYADTARLLHESLDRACWRLIERIVRYAVTPGSPSWFQRGRAKQTPLSLRHIARNKERLYAELCRLRWEPMQTLGYDGPPASLRGSESASVSPPAMSRQEAEALYEEIAAQHPYLLASAIPFLDICALKEFPERYVVGLRIGPGAEADDFLDFYSANDWRRPDAALRTDISAALAWIQQCVHREQSRQQGNVYGHVIHGFDCPG